MKSAALLFGVSLKMSGKGDRQTVSITVDGTVVAVSGELDVASAGELADTLRATDGRAVDVDLSGISFIDPAGLRILLTAKRDSDARGGELVIRDASWQVRRLAELSGTAEDLGLVDPAQTRAADADDRAGPGEAT